MANFISGQHYKCMTAFRTLFKVLDDGHQTRQAKASMQLQDDFDRYHVWAANLGAAFYGSDYKRSLDYRLREAGPYKEAILKVLLRIGYLVEQLVTTLRDNDRLDRRPDSSHSSSQEDEQEYTDDNEDSSWSLSSDEILDQKAPSPATQQTEPSALSFRLTAGRSSEPPSSAPKSSSKLETLLKSLNFSITALYKVPVRRSANIDQAYHLARWYNINLDYFEPFDVEFVRELFRDADERIILRLGCMITRRRQILRARSLRIQDLRREAVNSTQRQSLLLGLPERPAEVLDVTESCEEGQEDGGGEHTLSTTKSSLKATTFKPEGPPYLGGFSYLEAARSEVAESVSSIATTRTAQDLIIIPPRPLKENGTEKEDFECPFCCTLVHIRGAHTWKRHVLCDLQPYTCTYSDCDEPNLLLDDREVWYEHELQHLSEYQCGDAQHSSFEGAASFVTHMKEQHAFDEDGQLHGGVLKMFLKPRKEARKFCPLCLHESKDVKRHLGRHLQRIALFALPRNHGEVDDDEAASQVSSLPGAAARRVDIDIEDTEQSSATSTDHSSPEIAEGSHTVARNEEGERVFCHSCQHEWDREQGGLKCPQCESEFTEPFWNTERAEISFEANKERLPNFEEAIGEADLIPDSEPTTWERIKPELYKRNLMHDQPELGASTSNSLKPKDGFNFRRSVGVCLGQAPYIDPTLFIGRSAEIDQMSDVLRPGDMSQEQRRLILGGIGGIGKTQLAISYAKHHLHNYESVFWLNATSEAILKDSFRTVAEVVFDVQDLRFSEGEQILIHIHRWLSDKKNSQWLLIFDNYDNPEQYNIGAYYPPASHGAIIITTRLPHLVAGTTLRIKHLQKIEGLKVLQTRSRRENITSDLHAERLAQRLAGFPLALATAGAFLYRSSFTFERYLQEYEKHWNIDLRRGIQLQEYQDRTLYTTWDVSYSRLKSDDPDAAKLLKVLAYFDNQSVWYELLRGGLTDDLPKWLYEVISDDISFDSVMGALTDYCFLEAQTALQSWSMHVCVHDWSVAVLNKAIDEREYWYAFDCIAASINEDDVDSLGHLLYARLAAHAAWLVHDRFRQDDLIINIVPNRLDKALRIAQLLTQQVQIAAAEQMYLWALAGYEKTLGVDHTSTLSTVDNLGSLYRNQGKLAEAEQMYVRALVGKEKALGPDHTSTLSTVDNLGSLYRNQGKLAEAEQMYVRALVGKEKALGPDHTSTLSTVDNLGSLYRNQGKLAEAEQMYVRALVGKEKVLGPDHTSTLSTVDNLGSLYRNQGKLAEAEQMYVRALVGKEKALGPDHTSTLSTVDNLGSLYRKQGKLAEAEQMYLQALAGFEKALGAAHPSTVATMNNLQQLASSDDKHVV